MGTTKFKLNKILSFDPLIIFRKYHYRNTICRLIGLDKARRTKQLIENEKMKLHFVIVYSRITPFYNIGVLSGRKKAMMG